MDNREKIFYILDKLEAEYHNEARSPELGHPEPLDGLILTILSQNTNDKNRDAAFENLKLLYPTWHEVINAGQHKLEHAIKTAGLAHTKAERIIHILQKVYEDFHAYSIKDLQKFSRDYICEYLRALPGVGAKTVACVLLFDMKLPAFPVDTHVSRVIRRVGIVTEKTSAEEISHMLEDIVPVSRCLGGHVNIIAHGRAVCRSRKPACNSCVLSEICKGVST